MGLDLHNPGHAKLSLLCEGINILPEATLLPGAVVLLLPPVRFVFLAMFPKLPHNR